MSRLVRGDCECDAPLGAFFAVGLVLLMSTMYGCGSNQDHAVEQLREKFLLPGEPVSAQSIQEALESLSTADPSGGAIVVVGRIFAKELDPFEKGQASFILSEIPVSDHGGADHDAESCPFCKRRMAKSPLASVRFVDENGGTLPFDARRIFGIKKGQVVVIKGRATSEISVGTPLLSLQADGLFVRNE